MPFFLIPTALGVCFFLIWVFIGGMIFRDGQLAAQREREFGRADFAAAGSPRAAERRRPVESARSGMRGKTGARRVVRVQWLLQAARSAGRAVGCRMIRRSRVRGRLVRRAHR